MDATFDGAPEVDGGGVADPTSPDDDAGAGPVDAGGSVVAPDPRFGLGFEAIEIPEAFALRLSGHRYLPGSDELLLWNQTGLVGHFRRDGDELELLGSFELGPGTVEADCGIQLAIDPDFADNGQLYFTQCDSAQSSGVYRYVFDPSDYAAIPASAVLIIREEQADAERALHNVGAVGFDAEDRMWVLFGDKLRTGNGQDRSTNLGALLRLHADQDPSGGYLPVDDNPFASDPDASGDIYAYGLRSPYFGLLDHRGFYWIADVGSDSAEEINLVTEAGQNFGYRRVEGYCDPDERDCSPYVDPLFSWPHTFDHDFYRDDPDVSTRSARVAYVGVEYLPHATDPYRGQLDYRVLFGDMCSGFVRAARIDSSGNVIENRHVGHLEGPISWQQAPDGRLTVATYGRCTNGEAEGQLYEVVGVWDDER